MAHLFNGKAPPYMHGGQQIKRKLTKCPPYIKREGVESALKPKLTRTQPAPQQTTKGTQRETGTPGKEPFVVVWRSSNIQSLCQGRVCLDNFMRCHTEVENAYQTCYPTQSLYIDTGPTSPTTDPIAPGAWQGSNSSA